MKLRHQTVVRVSRACGRAHQAWNLALVLLILAAADQALAADTRLTPAYEQHSASFARSAVRSEHLEVGEQAMFSFSIGDESARETEIRNIFIRLTDPASRTTLRWSAPSAYPVAVPGFGEAQPVAHDVVDLWRPGLQLKVLVPTLKSSDPALREALERDRGIRFSGPAQQAALLAVLRDFQLPAEVSPGGAHEATFELFRRKLIAPERPAVVREVFRSLRPSRSHAGMRRSFAHGSSSLVH